ncbi:hypothetical protein EAH87_14670 [Sphingomonas koreensis]|nr:hypothetical protein EAH87_14670 [Sphingomonas koreensis]
MGKPNVATDGIAQPSSDARRSAERQPKQQASTLRSRDQQPIDVLVADISTTGFGVLSGMAFEVGDEVTLGLPGYGSFEARVVRRYGDLYGCQFAQPITAAMADDVFAKQVVAQLRPDGITLPSRILSDRKWPLAARGWVLLGFTTAAWATIACLAPR